MAIIAPCKDCADRYIACHSVCDKYKNWKRELDTLKSEIDKSRYFQMDANLAKHEGIKRMKKVKRRKKSS